VSGEILKMTANGWLQFVAFLAVLLLLMRPLGLYIARVVEGEKTSLDPLLRPIERLLYRACGIQADQEMSWQQYSVAMLIVSFVSLLLTYVIERAQGLLPWNPQQLAVLCARNHHELFHPDGGLGVSQLFERGDRYRGRRRPGPRHRP
jgi:K+-transporting ATPase ATPase A chain